jgi:hypothetical protein
MTDQRDEILLSQLADGELPSDQANEVLLGVLDCPDERERLKGLLRLRQTTSGWRAIQPQRPVMVVAQRPQSFARGRAAWRVGSLAVAACVGGLLVLAGVWAAGLPGNAGRPGGTWAIGPRPEAAPAVGRVSLEQMQQVAKVFALHESVAGPLAWYAADDRNIRVASAHAADAGQAPIGVLLKLDSSTPGVGARTLVIVCRNDQPAVIELPAEPGEQAGLRVYLTPRAVNGKVDVQYAIAMDGQSQAPLASLSGQRRLGLADSPLGQLAVGDRVLNVEAAAWPMPQDRK